MGPLGPDSEFTEGVTRVLKARGLDVIIVDVTRGKYIPEQVGALLGSEGSIKISSLLVLGWGGGNDQVANAFGNSNVFRDAVVDWTNKGGRFMVQGNANVCGNWPQWFGKEWADDGYYRTTHTCFAKQGGRHWCQWYHEAPNAVTKAISVKSILVKNVASDEILFGTTSESRTQSLVPFMAGQPIEEGVATVAFAQYGEGTVAFFGDVNLETPTLDIMAVLARGKLD